MTKTWARRSVQASAIAAGFLLLSAGAAQADQSSTGNVGAGDGNQAVSPIQAPIDACGNAATLLGASDAGCAGGSTAHNTEAGHVQEYGTDLDSTGNVGVGNGNQVYAPIQAPVNVCGNSVSAAGVAGSGCAGGSQANLNGMGSPDATSTGNVGVGNGNQLIMPVQAPVDVCGNAITVAGLSHASCHGGSTADAYTRAGESAMTEALPTLPTGALNGLPVGSVGKLTGNLPTSGLTDTVTGAAGHATSTAKDTASKAGVKPEASRITEHGAGGSDLTSTGNVGVGNGNQVYAPIQIPVEISGNAISVGGISTAGSHGGSTAVLH
ncbi:MAG TPA: chaplin family protein [Stackebrandtia sp.]|uniref:chaplin family protein n=1 Tax=Stackebrandtia sp. TaxID=2023065 RepID=UPI002D254F33|nr:chaplin family protein [Stackebrandtia sp.]HZE41205.1 chaplin family protein [Stackebrandtia sp.]